MRPEIVSNDTCIQGHRPVYELSQWMYYYTAEAQRQIRRIASALGTMLPPPSRGANPKDLVPTEETVRHCLEQAEVSLSSLMDDMKQVYLDIKKQEESPGAAL